MNIKYMSKCALLCALICVLAPLSIPLSTLVPISLATFVIMLIGTIFDYKLSTIAVCLYLLMGFVGVPVFAGYESGPTVMFGVTGGFLFGYIPLAFCTAFLTSRKQYKLIGMLEGMIIGTIILYLIGTIWFMVYLNTTIDKALMACVIPFLLGDLIKIFMVCVISPKFKKAIGDKL